MSALARHEDHWRAALGAAQLLGVPLASRSDAAPDWQSRALSLPGGLDRPEAARRVARWAALSAGREGHLAYRSKDLAALVAAAPGDIAPWAPLRSDDVVAGLAAAGAHQGIAADLGLRLAGAPRLDVPLVGLSGDGAPIAGTVLSVLWPEGRLMIDAARVGGAAADLLVARLNEALQGTEASLPDADRAVLERWHGPDVDLRGAKTIHGAFEAQVARSPDADALVLETIVLSYAALNARADAVAAALQEAGVTRGTHVALCVARGPGY